MTCPTCHDRRHVQDHGPHGDLSACPDCNPDAVSLWTDCPLCGGYRSVPETGTGEGVCVGCGAEPCATCGVPHAPELLVHVAVTKTGAPWRSCPRCLPRDLADTASLRRELLALSRTLLMSMALGPARDPRDTIPCPAPVPGEEVAA